MVPEKRVPDTVSDTVSWFDFIFVACWRRGGVSYI